MPSCPSCGAAADTGARFCASCGAPQVAASQMPTEAASARTPRTPAASTPTSPIGRLDTSASLFGARFQPGQTLAGRYRIVGLLGRGGMGEVYRADDLTLGQAVSLKFLPRSLNENAEVLGRFRAEVRNARQVSHPNVCRVYDIGEFEDQLFLTMEYVDGEDIAVLLRRIGRLPAAKANEVARQICAGLAAAHDRGVLHRDLKPSNIMIDNDGRVRITDFGLAVRVDEGASDTAGTPAYMSPEQFEGKPAGVPSDLYALGLILFEIYAGRRTFEASTVEEWRSRHTRTQPPSPTTVDPDIDPIVERVILRCLEKDPSKRPASALKVAAALPGGDPLEAALAAGETPSPEMVAAAGGEGAASARRAWGVLAASLLTIVAVVLVSPASTDLGLSRIHKSADVLMATAGEIASENGYEADPVDRSGWFFRNYDPMLYKAKNTPSTEWRKGMREWFPPLGYQYRQSPRWMPVAVGDGRVSSSAPPHELSGMLMVTLDGQGRLIGLRGVPPDLDTARVAPTEPDWAPLFKRAGLDLASFTETTPRWVPSMAYDVRREWQGDAPWAPGVPLEVTAASFAGRPVSFAVRGPWSRPTRMTGPQRTRGTLGQGILGVVIALVVCIAVFFAWRNIRLGRGDHRGAIRVGVFFALGQLAIWIVGAHHVGDQSEVGVFRNGLTNAIGAGVMILVIYLAVEPYVRRRIPELLIGWARVLEGRFRDPRVGHDVLMGVLLASLTALVVHLANGLPTWFPFPGQTTISAHADALVGGRMVVAFLLQTVMSGMGGGLFLFSLFCLLRILLRKQVIAMVVFGAVMFVSNMGGENPMLELPASLFTAVLSVVAVSRFGLLANVALWTIANFLAGAPLPLAPGAPYFATSLIVLGVILATTLYAFRVSMGPRPLFTAIDT